MPVDSPGVWFPAIIVSDLDVRFSVTWLVWLAAFLIVEGVALFNSRPGDTLSEHVWRWFGTRRADYAPDRRPPRLPRLILGAFMLWLSLHFLTGGQF